MPLLTDSVWYRAEPQNKWGFSTLKGIDLCLNFLSSDGPIYHSSTCTSLLIS